MAHILSNKMLPVASVALLACQGAGAATATGAASPARSSAAQKAPKPNIIFILADDLGYGDIGILGQKTIKTPNLDRLAREGMIFTNHYSGAPVSAPSRCSLMTGKHTGHTSIRGHITIPHVGVAPLWPSDVTLPEAIKNGTDYVTGMTGRWHLGGELTNQTPHHRGFDYHFGKLSSDFPNKHGVLIDGLWDADGKHVPYSQYSAAGFEPMYENGKLYNLSPEEMKERPINMDRLVTDHAKAFIEREKDKHFFLYVAYALVHAPMEYQDATPVTQPNDWPDTERAFASMVMSLDKYVGEIMNDIDRLGLGQKTLIIFSSDNGAHNEGGHSHLFFQSTGDFRGYKRDVYDGGFHTPMFCRWTGTIKAGSTNNLLSAFWDFMPTLCDLAGAPAPKITDGISFVPTLLGKPQTQKHEFLYWEFDEHADMKKDRTPDYKQAVVFGPWKVLEYLDAQKIEVYDLVTDPGEEHDVAAEHPDIVQKGLHYMAISHVQNPIFPMLPSERNFIPLVRP